MKKYNEFFLLNCDTVKDFVKDNIAYFDKMETLYSDEIGDGNINYVFRVGNGQRSVVVKQSDKYIRTSGRALDLTRSKIEVNALKIEGELAKGYVPEVYYYEPILHAIIMEDISDFKNLRCELMQGRVFKNLADNITDFLVNTLLPTTDLALNRKVKKERVKNFINPELCDISEDLVFTEPYYDYKKRNIILEGNLDFVKMELYEDENLKAEVGKLRDKFINYSQSLLHGDLHSGSIFINDTGIKIIDPEFAFYGPMGYDIGNVIGNLVFSLVYHKLFTKNQEFVKYMQDTITDVFDLFKEKLGKKYDEIVKFPFYRIEGFKNNYINEIMSDSLGFAGTEIIRRVVGDAKVSEVTSIKEAENRLEVERTLINIGKNCIKRRNELERCLNWIYKLGATLLYTK